MPEAAPSITRRGFLGHVAGAYTAASLFAVPALPGALDALIARHRAAAARLCAAGDRCDAEHDAPESLRANEAAVEAHEAVYEALLRFRPETLEEAGRKMAYLAHRGGPWYGCIPDEWEIRLLVQSIIPEIA